MCGENDARFSSGILQCGENETQLEAAETAESNFVFAGSESVNACWVFEAEQLGGRAFLGRNLQQCVHGLAADFLNAADIELVEEKADELRGLGRET